MKTIMLAAALAAAALTAACTDEPRSNTPTTPADMVEVNQTYDDG
ncbi:hypothetical protein [Sphingomonas sp. BK069]|nr:hypothetical protein [Sphingomonas sp. BK069]MBB3348802.1 chitodextrinase [Sphingomonas sp. BK069]